MAEISSHSEATKDDGSKDRKDMSGILVKQDSSGLDSDVDVVLLVLARIYRVYSDEVSLLHTVKGDRRIYSPYQIDHAHAPAKKTLAPLGHVPEIAAHVNGIPMFIAIPTVKKEHMSTWLFLIAKVTARATTRFARPTGETRTYPTKLEANT